MTTWEEYTYHTAAHGASLGRLRKTVLEVVADKRLCSRMNDTAWLALQNAVRELPFAPAYVLRRVTDTEDPSWTWGDRPPWWEGDWNNYYEEGMPPLFDIEWITVWPQKSLHRGRLVPDAVLDATGAFRGILERLHIPYEEARGLFTVYGYIRA